MLQEHEDNLKFMLVIELGYTSHFWLRIWPPLIGKWMKKAIKYLT